MRRHAACSSEWDTFGQGHLHGVQRVRHPEVFRPLNRSAPRNREGGLFQHGAGYQGLFIPTPTFAFCLIEKIGCSTWNQVLQHLTPFPPRMRNRLPERNARADEVIRLVFSDPNAVRAVFVRDPLERFASAFVNKCYDEVRGFNSSLCIPAMVRGAPIGRAVSFGQAVQWMLRVRNPAATNTDGHWRAQSGHCELATRVHEFTIIGKYQKSTFERDAQCLLEEARLGAWEKAFVSPREAFNPARSTEDGDTAEFALLQKLYTRESGEAMMRHFEHDYRTFRLPPPAWLANATGEWSDMSCVPSLAHKSGFACPTDGEILTREALLAAHGFSAGAPDRCIYMRGSQNRSERVGRVSRAVGARP